MRSTCSVYIDAGYLLAASAARITGTSLRSGIHVEYRPLVGSLVRAAEQWAGLPVLRVHWYDSARDGVPDATQERIGELPKVKLRLGRFGYNGEQKGVDLRIGLDLVAHARNRASDVFFLVSGDDDLTEAVEEAQAHGVQVVVLAVPGANGRPHGVSRHLVRAADELECIDAATVDAAVIKREAPRIVEPAEPAEPSPATVAMLQRPPVPTPLDLVNGQRRPMPAGPASVIAYTSTGASGPAALADEPCAQSPLIDGIVARVLASFLESATPEAVRALERARPSIPGDIDRALLFDASDALGIYYLDEGIRYRLRARFWNRYDETPAAGAAQAGDASVRVSSSRSSV